MFIYCSFPVYAVEINNVRIDNKSTTKLFFKQIDVVLHHEIVYDASYHIRCVVDHIVI